MVSLVPLPLGSEIQGLMPSPMTKMLVTLQNISCFSELESEMNIPSSKSPVKRVLDVDDIEASNVLLPVHNNTSPAHVTSAGDHDDVSGIELDEIGDLVLLKVKLDGVIGTNEGVGVTDGAAVVGDNMGDTTVSDSDTADLQELVGSLFGGDAVDGEAALNIVKETEVLARLFDGDDI